MIKLDNKEALAWLQRELNHQKYCQDFADRRIADKYQVVIDALEVAADAVSKQIAKRVIAIEGKSSQACPVCKANVRWKYCHNCGQKIDYTSYGNTES